MLRIALFGAATFGLILAVPVARAERPEGPPPATAPLLTLKEALALALKENPTLAATSEEVHAREAEALQAGLRPNPVLSLEAENVAGSGDYSGTEAAETTVSVSQTLELGGKRRLRQALAASETAAAEGDYALARADVLARTSERFITVLAAQERLELAGELLGVARRGLATVEERISAGKAAETERVRTRILVAELETERAKARLALEAARRGLAAQMGRERADFPAVAGDLDRLPPMPSLGELDLLLGESPRLVRRIADVERRRRAVELERARRIPDVEVGIGARRLSSSDDNALVLGLSLPIPLFDRNQGGRAAAGRRLAQARMEERSALLEAKAALASAWQEMSAAHREAGTLRDEILPAARQALEASEYGYKAGKFGILDVLDTQRTLVEARGRHLEALSSFHRAAAEMERLLGKELPATDESHLQTAKE